MVYNKLPSRSLNRITLPPDGMRLQVEFFKIKVRKDQSRKNIAIIHQSYKEKPILIGHRGGGDSFFAKNLLPMVKCQKKLCYALWNGTIFYMEVHMI